MATKILVFDNYDSFTYNLVHLVEKILHTKVDVVLNDQLKMEDVKKYDKIILSPGPGLPVEAGSLLPLIHEYAATKSILGVCLGLQAIAESFGAQLFNLDTVYHGISSPLTITDKDDILFNGIDQGEQVGRYHSWMVSEDGLPGCFDISAKDDQGRIMALCHKSHDLRGVQFHPESVLTPCGEKILRNWLSH
jgi:anthranilate synthase component 2